MITIKDHVSSKMTHICSSKNVAPNYTFTFNVCVDNDDNYK